MIRSRFILVTGLFFTGLQAAENSSQNTQNQSNGGTIVPVQQGAGIQNPQNPNNNAPVFHVPYVQRPVISFGENFFYNKPFCR